MADFDFEDLFIFELANNHQGSVEHGVKIISELAQVALKHEIRAAIKLQFRHLDSFIHPAHQISSENKHVARFKSTNLSKEDFRTLMNEVQDKSFISMCTPFDEPSVDQIEELGIEVIKIGSPSANDWPLIERIALTGLPVLFSTGGLSLKEIDALVSFFDHRKVPFAMMHCVSIYPTPPDQLDLSQIAALSNRYPNRVIGYSGHEGPDDISVVQLAAANGARIFERHVGLETDDIQLNAYSLSPDQVDRWVGAWRSTLAMLGARKAGREVTHEEASGLDSLRRGVYARRVIKNGKEITDRDIYFAMPLQPGQLPPGDWTAGIRALSNVEKDGPLLLEQLGIPSDRVHEVIYTAIHSVKALLNEARVALPSEFKLELSHHYGMENFDKVGATLIDCVNREYCKKVIVQIPGQKNPMHYHKRKEETFQVLHGILELEVDDRRRTLYPGDTLLVLPGVWHSFWSETGTVFEEISTTHYTDDSYYADQSINKMTRESRKTVVEHWGRYQLKSIVDEWARSH